ncbi:hypothetical protein CMI37_11735 [Candidatus Pacearchaeota archaeon]|nr:hypothetical protein [Candidatus Pacearchaeota archaeon]|tara:strand:- start:884 stop:1585 length:702 start_codon:yes stop_codon:yes gene_type:complete
MIRTTGDIETEFLVRMQQSTTVAFITDTILDDWVDQAHVWASAYKKWPFTEGRNSTTYASVEEFVYPEGFKSDSIRYLKVGTKRLKKVLFREYQNYREDSDTGEDLIFSDFGGLYYINPNADISGTVTAYGQFTPRDFDRTDLTEVTVFSDREEEGNEAIIEKMMNYAKTREKKFAEADAHDLRAKTMLEEVWKRITDEQFGYQGHKSAGIWQRIDVERGARVSDLDIEDRFF